MKIKWHLVLTIFLIALVVNLHQVNGNLQKDTGQLIKEKTEIDDEKTNVKILENKLIAENKKPVMVEKEYKIGWKELKKLTLKKINNNKKSSSIKVIMRDDYYYYTEKEILEDIIKNDGTEKIDYVEDKRDCDDFESIFNSNLSKYYLLNNVGTVIGMSTDIETDEPGHAWNIILVKENGENNLYFFEPQTDEISPVGAEISVDGKRYDVETIEW